MRTWTIICLTFSWTALKGIGTIIGAVWATYDAFVNGQKYALLALPLLHAFAIWNVLERMDQSAEVQDLLVGTVLMLSGILMTIMASKTEMAWNWNFFEWDDEIEYYGWIDRVGQLGIAYFLIGISWAIGDADLGKMLWVVWAAFLSGIAIQGFRDETETPWRRGIGSMGTIFALFMLSFEFTTSLYTYVTWMFMGVVALGFGFAYIARMGEVSTIFTENYTEVKEAIIQQSGGGNTTFGQKMKQIEPIPEPVTSQDDVDEDEESEPEVIDEVEEVIDIDSDDLDDLEDLLDEDVTMADDAVEVKSEEKVPEKDSTFDYDLQLDPAVMSAIQNSLANTPHDGYKPVVSIGSNGNLKIDFVPI